MAIALTVVIALGIAVVAWLARPDDTGASALDRMAARGTIVIGVFADQPGIGVQDGVSENWSGFDVEIARLVAAKLGYGEDKVMYVPVDEYDRDEYLTSRAVDMVVAAYPITEENRREVSFAGPYLTSGPGLLVRAGESIGATSMRGHKVCAAKYSTSAEELLNSGLVEQSDVETGLLGENCVDWLLNHRVDAIYSDEIALTGFAAERPDLLDLNPVSTTSVEYGIALAHDDKPLRDRVNDILKAALNDGTWRAIYDRTLGRSGVDPGVPTVRPN